MIIDASVVFKVLVEEEGTERAKVIIADCEGLAPHLILSEVGNALWKAIRRGELLPANASDSLSTVPQLVTLLDEADIMARAVELAIELKHPVYDCVYLALAERRNVRLVTADKRFLRVLAGTAFGDLAEDLMA